jgi:type IV pilus assembly protein PilM
MVIRSLACISISFSRKDVNKAAVNPIRKLIHSLLPQQITLGLEITDTSIKLAEVSPDGSDGFRLHTCHVEPLPKGTVDDGRIINPLKLIQALQHSLKVKGFKCKKAQLVLPSHLIMVRFIKLPDIPVRDLQKVVDFEVKHNIHLPFEQPIYDFVKLNGVNNKRIKAKKPKETKETSPTENNSPDQLFMQEAAAAFGGSSAPALFGEEEKKSSSESPPQVCDVMLAAAPQELVLQYMEVMKSAGLTVCGIDIKALALFRIIELTEPVQPDGTMLVVEVNQTYTDLSIFHHRQLKITRSVPLSFEEAKKEEAKPADNDPFRFFQEFEESSDSQFQNTCGDLVHELERLMNFYRYTLNNRTQEFDTLVLSGDAVRLIDIQKLLSERLDARIVLMGTDKLRTVDDDSFDQFPAFAVPIGLGMRGRSG